MKARLILPVCERCGYRYDPKNPRKPVLHFMAEDGDYLACADCISEFGRLTKEGTDEEKAAFLASFKFDKGEAQ